MKTKKSESPPQGYSVNELSKLTGADRRTIDKAIAAKNLQPTIKGNVKLYALAEVEQVLKDKPDKSLREEKLTEEIRKLRLKNDKDEGKLVTKAAVVKCFQEHCAESRPLRHQKLEREYPAAVACMEIPQARLYGTKLADDLDAIDHRLGERLEALGL